MDTLIPTFFHSRYLASAKPALDAQGRFPVASGGVAWRSARAVSLALGLALLGGECAAAIAESIAGAPAPGGYLRPPTPQNPLGDDELILDEIFQSHLPTTLKRYALRLSVHPHLGDLNEKDHIRLTTSLRYGLTDNCEISASSNLYVSHGLGEIRAFDKYGAPNLQLGTKFDLGQFLFPGWETGAGVSYEFPLGRPVPELTDGLRHLRPYVTFSHRLESHPDLRIFVGLRVDQISTTSIPGSFGKNAFRESSSGITGGWVIDRANWHYTFEASFDTTRLLTRTEEDLYTIRPGVIWEIPTRRNRQVMSHWVAGVSVNDTFGPGGNSVGASFRLRYSSDLKNRFHRTPVAPHPEAAATNHD